MRKTIILAVMVMVLCSGFFGNILLNAMASDNAACEKVVLYKSIQIREGDTLWKIAEEYAPGLDLGTADYIDCLRRMNGLREDTIHAGRYLTVMYDGSVG